MTSCRLNKKVIIINLLVLCAISFFSCEKHVDEILQLENSYTLNWNISYMPRYFYPSISLLDTEKQIVNNLYEGLTRVENGDLIYGMAESVEISPDGLEYNFKLKNAQWSDGVIVKSDDFIYSWERSDNYWQNQNLIYYDTFIDHVEAGDGRHLKIVLKHPNEKLLYQLSTISFMPIRRDIINLDKPIPNFISDVTNGPYVLNSEFMFSRISLSKNIHYYDYFNVKIDKIKIVLDNNYNNVYLKYLNNEFDIVQSISNKSLNNLIQIEDNFKLFKKNGVYNFSINLENEYLKNDDTRRMLNLAIDRSEINPYGEIINDTVITSLFYKELKNELVKGSNDEFEFMKELYTYNATKNFAEKDKIDKLKNSMDETDFKELSEISITTLNTPNDIEIANLLKYIWEDNLGIKVKIKIKDRYDYTYALRTNTYDIIINNYYFVESNPRHMLKYFLSDTVINSSEFKEKSFDAKMLKTFSYSDANLHDLYENLMDELDNYSVNISLFQIYEPAIINPEIIGWSRSYESLFYFGRASKIKNEFLSGEEGK